MDSELLPPREAYIEQAAAKLVNGFFEPKHYGCAILVYTTRQIENEAVDNPWRGWSEFVERARKEGKVLAERRFADKITQAAFTDARGYLNDVRTRRRGMLNGEFVSVDSKNGQLLRVEGESPECPVPGSPEFEAISTLSDMANQAISVIVGTDGERYDSLGICGADGVSLARNKPKPEEKRPVSYYELNFKGTSVAWESNGGVLWVTRFDAGGRPLTKRVSDPMQAMDYAAIIETYFLVQVPALAA